MAARVAAVMTTQVPAPVWTRMHHAHSVIQIPSSRETPYDAVALAAAS
jgi:hypothetical protein